MNTLLKFIEKNQGYHTLKKKLNYGKYAEEVLAKQMDPAVLEEIRTIESKKDFSNPRYMELLMPNYYEKHLCRIP